MITTSFRNKILRLMTAQEKKIETSGKCYLGFSTTTPNEAGGNFTEPSAAANPSYKRVQLNINVDSSGTVMTYTNLWGEVSDGAVSNAKEISTPECREADGWGTFTHFGIFETETGGTPILFDLLTDPDGSPDEDGIYPAKPLTVTEGHVATFAIGSLRLMLK